MGSLEKVSARSTFYSLQISRLRIKLITDKGLKDQIKKGASLKKTQSLNDKSSPVLVAEIENSMEEDLKEQIKQGVSLKKARSFDRSGPAIFAEIEEKTS